MDYRICLIVHIFYRQKNQGKHTGGDKRYCNCAYS